MSDMDTGFCPSSFCPFPPPPAGKNGLVFPFVEFSSSIFFAARKTSQIAIDLDVKKSISGHKMSVERCTLPKLIDIKCVLADCSGSIGAYPWHFVAIFAIVFPTASSISRALMTSDMASFDHDGVRHNHTSNASSAKSDSENAENVGSTISSSADFKSNSMIWNFSLLLLLSVEVLDVDACSGC